MHGILALVNGLQDLVKFKAKYRYMHQFYGIIFAVLTVFQMLCEVEKLHVAQVQ